MYNISVPIIVQSKQLNNNLPTFYGQIGTLQLVFDASNNYESGSVSFTKPQALVGRGDMTISPVGQTPVVQNGALLFQVIPAANTYPPQSWNKSKPPFTFTGQIDLTSQQVTGQAAWLPQGFMTALEQTSTSALGNFTQSTSSFTNSSVLSLSQWPNPSYSQSLLATGLQVGTSAEICDLQLVVPNNVPNDATLYLLMQGGTNNSEPLDIYVWQGGQMPMPPPLLASVYPASSGFAWYAWPIPSSFLRGGTNYIRLANLGNVTDGSATIYIKYATVVW